MRIYHSLIIEKSELYCDHNNFTIPAFANIYNNEETYKQAEYKVGQPRFYH